MKKRNSARKSKPEQPRVVVTKDGCYLVQGSIPLAKETIVTDSEGHPVKWAKLESYPKQESYALCRCGASRNKPYCDASHEKLGFDGTETASREEYLKTAEKIVGPSLILTDAGQLCFGAGFCHSKQGSVWDLTEKSGDSSSRKTAVLQACNCPSGRLVVWDKKTREPIEPEFRPSISLVEEPGKGVSGPIWVKGGVPIESSSGIEYEKRNRVCLCRCGASDNKPFCDGTHVPLGFNDGDKSLRKRADSK
jgi:CDGSH-type Zn-finger protein